MMLQMAFGMAEAAQAVEKAVRQVLKEGYRTGDIAKTLEQPKMVGCKEMGDLVAARIA